MSKKRNIPLILGFILMLIAVIFLSGVATALLIPQMIALFEFFGYEVAQPNIWDVYLPLMTLLLMPIVLMTFAVILRRPAK